MTQSYNRRDTSVERYFEWSCHVADPLAPEKRH